MNIDKFFFATKAFVVHEGKVLLLRESAKYSDGSNVGLYDVPGGRLKPGQRFDDSLQREIKEETGLAVIIGKPFFVHEWRPKVHGEQWQIVGTFFLCQAATDKVTLSSDHDEYVWIDPAKYKALPVIKNLTAAFQAYLAQ